MDLHTVTTMRVARSRQDLALGPGEALLAGGTWLFSEPQPRTTGLVDLTGLQWPAWEELPDGLRIGATCTIAEVTEAPWGDAIDLVRQCADSFLMSSKVQRLATVGGNVCLALPAAAMVSLAAGLGATVVVWTPGGGERREAAAEFVRGPGRTSLQPGEIVRAIDVPAAALQGRTAFRRIGLTAMGRASAVVVGCDRTVTITAATERPVVVAVDALEDGLAAIDCWYSDPHGAPDWRRAVATRLAREVAQELAA